MLLLSHFIGYSDFMELAENYKRHQRTVAAEISKMELVVTIVIND